MYCWHEKVIGKFGTAAVGLLEQISGRAAELSIYPTSDRVLLLAMRGLLLSEEKLGFHSLKHMGVDIETLNKQVLALIEAEQGKPQEVALRKQGKFLQNMTLSPLKKGHACNWNVNHVLVPLIDETTRQSERLRRPGIGDEHILMALIVLAPPPLAKLFEEHDITVDGVEQFLSTILPDSTPDDS